ncbi:hypothetical protein [Microcystis phage Mel-JY01]
MYPPLFHSTNIDADIALWNCRIYHPLIIGGNMWSRRISEPNTYISHKLHYSAIKHIKSCYLLNPISTEYPDIRHSVFKFLDTVERAVYTAFKQSEAKDNYFFGKFVKNNIEDVLRFLNYIRTGFCDLEKIYFPNHYETIYKFPNKLSEIVANELRQNNYVDAGWNVSIACDENKLQIFVQNTKSYTDTNITVYTIFIQNINDAVAYCFDISDMPLHTFMRTFTWDGDEYLQYVRITKENIGGGNDTRYSCSLIVGNTFALYFKGVEFKFAIENGKYRQFRYLLKYQFFLFVRAYSPFIYNKHVSLTYKIMKHFNLDPTVIWPTFNPGKLNKRGLSKMIDYTLVHDEVYIDNM